MLITAKVTSKVSNRVVYGIFTARQLLDFLDKDELVTNLTKCNCEPVGETNYTECNCGDEWEDYELVLGDDTV